MQIWIPPIDLPDGRRLSLAGIETQAVIEPIRFLITDPQGGLIRALYHADGNRWEVVS